MTIRRHTQPTANQLGLRHARQLEPRQYAFLRFRRQWAILDQSDATPKDWPVILLSCGLKLTYHPEARVLHSSTSTQTVIFLIGTAVQPLGRGADIGQLLDSPDITSHDGRVRLLRSLGGIYVLVSVSKDAVRIYTDPGALMAVYYGRGRAASTPGLLPDLRRDIELDERYPLRGSDDWYPGDLCPFVDVKALLANHVLDLRTGAIERFWPLQPPEKLEKRVAVDVMCEILRGMARGYVGSGPILHSLTGGQDSRVNLAAVRPWLHKVEFFTIRGPHIKACDVEYPAALAGRFALDHRFVDNEDAPAWIYDLYSEMCAGFETRGGSSVVGACQYLASEEYIHVSGALGGITKSMFWPSRHPSTVEISALASEFTNKPDVVMDALRRWRDSLDVGLPAPLVYNLMYLEQRGGRWQSVSELGSNLFYHPATLFSSRELFELVSSIPVEYQYRGRLLYDFTRRMWPGLLDVPYCPTSPRLATHVPKRVRVVIKRILGRTW